ncbi:MAG: ABC transporter ATP-binding protein [Clostridia bacterium]|nr:ABC transporter ATP-binding protein [Clostridia bacterium]
MIVAQVENLNKKYNSYTLGVDDVSFAVKEGEVFGIIGPNGAGKTTIIKSLVGLLKPTKGSLALMQKNAFTEGHIVRNEVGYLGSDVSYFPNKTVEDNLKFVAEMHGVGTDRVDELTTALELNLTRKAKQLSYGNIKKMGIVMALLSSPKLIILDEPTNGLDPLVKQSFYKLIEKEQKRGAAIIITSHNLQDIQRLCDRVAILKQGKIIAIEEMAALKEKLLKKVTIETDYSEPEITLAGVSNVKRDGKYLTFNYNGELKKLVKYLHSIDVVDFNVTDADLESMFLYFYE